MFKALWVVGIQFKWSHASSLIQTENIGKYYLTMKLFIDIWESTS